VTVEGSMLIQQVDPATGRLGRKVAFPSKRTAGSAWDGRYLWQIAYEEKTLSKVDLESGRILEVMPTPGKGMCSGMTFDGRYLRVANFEDEAIYQIDPAAQGKIVGRLNGYYETTGIAWDGQYLWSGVLVTANSRPELAPIMGFIVQQGPGTGEPLQAIPLAGAGPGTTDWTPRGSQAKQAWWYDGYHHNIIRFDLPQSRRRELL